MVRHRHKDKLVGGDFANMLIELVDDKCNYVESADTPSAADVASAQTAAAQRNTTHNSRLQDLGCDRRKMTATKAKHEIISPVSVYS